MNNICLSGDDEIGETPDEGESDEKEKEGAEGKEMTIVRTCSVEEPFSRRRLLMASVGLSCHCCFSKGKFVFSFLKDGN